MADDSFRRLTLTMQNITLLIERTRALIQNEAAATRARACLSCGVMYDGREVPWLDHLHALEQDAASYKRTKDYRHRIAVLEGLLRINGEMRVMAGLRIMQGAGCPLGDDLCELIAGI
jgi:hypothetical protein